MPCARKVAEYLGPRDLFVVDAFAGAHPVHRLPLRVVTDSAWHALFARTMFIVPEDDEFATHVPEAVVLHAPGFQAKPDVDGTRAANFVLCTRPTRRSSSAARSTPARSRSRSSR